MLNRQDVVDAVRLGISDNLNTTFPSSDLDVIIDKTARTYSGYMPIVQRGNITTVNQQATYDLPDPNLMDLGAVLQWGTLPGILRDFFQVPPGMVPPQVFFHDPALAHIWQADVERYGHFNKPTLILEWEPSLTKYQIRLDPTPQSDGMPVLFEYTIPHQTDANGNYPSIPFDHTDVFIKLALADCLDAMATDMEKQGSTQEGDVKMDNSNSIRSMRRQAARERGQALSRLEGAEARVG